MAIVWKAGSLKMDWIESPRCGSGSNPKIPASAKLMLEAVPSCGCCAVRACDTLAASKLWEFRKEEQPLAARYSVAVFRALKYFSKALPDSATLMGGGGAVPS